MLQSAGINYQSTPEQVLLLCLCLALTSERESLLSWIMPAVVGRSIWRARKETNQAVVADRRLDEPS